MTSPLVSVVIATYNSGPYLQEAIDCVLGQTVRDIEVIVIDDGSTDDTRALVERVTDARLSYVWQPNEGQTSAKNHGIRLSKGQFIGFCDGDDYWYPDKLERQLDLFSRSKAGVVFSWVDVINEHGVVIERPREPRPRGNVTEQLFMTNFVPFGTALVRREAMEFATGFDSSLRMGIDWDLWLRISARYEFDFVPNATYAYRVWSGQMSKNWRGRYSSAFRIMNNFVQANPGRISGSLKRRAFADTYANRARARQHEHPLGAIADAARATMLDPATKYCWKTLFRMIADGIHRPRQGRRERHRLLKNLLAPLASRMTTHRPRIFAYHRFGAKSGNRVLGADEFRRQLLALKQCCEIVTLSEVLARDLSTTRKPLAAITVDDGYGDFYEFAAPVLRELGLKATLFVTTGFIEGKVHLWPDTLRALLDAAVGKSYRLKGFWRDKEIQLDGVADVEAAWSTLADPLVYTTPSERRRAIADLAESLGKPIDQLDMSRFAPMTWDQLRELRAEGFEIADHSYTHACLSMLSDEALHNELATSKSLLENRIGASVKAFAYPNGTRRDFDARTVETLRKLGYDCAVMSLPAPVDPERRFEIGRLPGDTAPEHFQRMLEGFGLVSR